MLELARLNRSTPIYFGLIAGLVALSGVVVAFFYGSNAGEPDLWRRIVRTMSMFTIQTNILVTMALLLPLIMPAAGISRFLLQPVVRTAILGYILFVCIVYHFTLAHQWRPQGMSLVSSTLTHYVAPTVFLLDWLLRSNRTTALPWSSAFMALIYPMAYVTWLLVHGAATGWYPPYPFINVPTLGYGQVLINIAKFMLAFFAIHLALVAVGRVIGRLRV